MIFSVTLNPAIDFTLYVEGLKPHDTNRVRRREVDAGGKGLNLSRVAVELGAESVASGFIGGGPGGFIRQVLDRQGVKHDFVETDGETRTNFSVEDGSGKPPTTFNAKGVAVSEAEWSEVCRKNAHWTKEAAWTALGGSLPPGVPVEAWRVLGEQAKLNRSNLLIDADGDAMRHAMEAAPDLIKPNRNEAERLLDRSLPDQSAVVEAAQDLVHLLRVKGADSPIAIISMGSNGAVLAGQDQLLFAPAIEVEAKSTIGSGDSLLGGFLCALEKGEDLATALTWGSAAGAATATTDGTEIARLNVFLQLLDRAEARPI